MRYSATPITSIHDESAFGYGFFEPAFTISNSVRMKGSAVNRVSRAGQVIGAGQRVAPMEGLKAMTIHSVRQHREDKIKGSLEAGKLANLVILDKNPLKVEPVAIKDIKVVETIKEGKTIYRAS